MKDESDPVSPDEFILRRIPNLPSYIKELPISVARAAFSPTDDDVDGVSVYREHFVTAKDVAEAGRSDMGYYVVRFKAEDLFNLGVSLVPNKQEDGLPGHTLIPELSLISKTQDKKKYKELALKITKLASNDIAFRPV